jgi:hypothetical protein
MRLEKEIVQKYLFRTLAVVALVDGTSATETQSSLETGAPSVVLNFIQRPP